MSKKRLENRQYSYWYLKDHPCIDCGEDDPVVLQYDHKSEFEKVANISRIIQSGSLKKLILEIQKCDVRCANCHARKTSIEQGWYRDLLP